MKGIQRLWQQISKFTMEMVGCETNRNLTVPCICLLSLLAMGVYDCQLFNKLRPFSVSNCHPFSKLLTS